MRSAVLLVFTSTVSISEKTNKASFLRAIERGKSSYTKVFTANIAREINVFWP